MSVYNSLVCKMRVDIVICTYNRAEKLKDTIQSIYNADIPDNVNARIIIVDNNSTDNTRELIEKYFQDDFGVDIKYLFEKKQGKSYALNTSLQHIACDIVAFTDDDVIVDRYWIKEVVNAAQRYPHYNCFGGKVIALYPQRMPKWLDVDGSMEFLRSALCNRDDGDIEIEYGNVTISKTPGGGNMFFRYNAIEKNGYFRTDLGPMGKELGFSEDTEFCQRLLEMGERFMYIPSAVVYHPVHLERLKKDYLLRWQYKCGRSEVRRNGGYKNTVKAFGIPKYLFRKFLHHVAGWNLSLRIKKRFYHRLRLYYTAGEIAEHIRIGLLKQTSKTNKTI